MALDAEDQEVLDGFLAEATELLEKLDDDLISLEKCPSDADLINGAFRSIHTIKGAASFLGFDQLVKVAHKTEDVMNRMRKGDLHLTPAVMDVILEAVDLIKKLIGDIKSGVVVERDIAGVSGQLSQILHEEAMSASGPEAQRADCEVKVTEGAREGEKSILQGKAAAGVNREDITDSSTVRVDVKRLDDLMNQVGELVLERNRMVQMFSDLRDAEHGPFVENLGKLTKRVDFVTSELQMQVLKMRMLPVEKVFKKFPRIVRNLARDLGKEVELQIIGEETELDRSVVDEISDPLIHLIRNALDHGLETPDERVAAGKERCGTVVLSAAHEGNQIVISIKDNGRGIDPEKIARKAIEKGLVTEEQMSAMGTREIIDLLFLPGFSTKEQTTDLSGRGVGMDVVRTNIRKLNGLIEVKNTTGHGTEFILRLPLTLAIIQSLLVQVGEEAYAIPLSSVIETLRVGRDDFHLIGDQQVLKLKNSVMPLLWLKDVFACKEAPEDSQSSYVVVVGVAEKRVGLVVTRLLGQQEVAIKSLGKYLTNINGIGGSTIMGDGKVALIVDPMALVEGHQAGRMS